MQAGNVIAGYVGRQILGRCSPAVRSVRNPEGWLAVTSLDMWWLIIVLALLLGVAWWAQVNLAKMRNVVKTAWADVDVQLKRRADLVPNLVETTKGYSGFEERVLREVTEARARAASGDLTPGQRSEAEAGLAQRIHSIIAIAEQYPELKASATYIRLQNELSETENKISYARQYYNAAVRDYNTLQQAFPSSLFASVFGHSQAEFFSAEEPDRQTPSASMSNP